MKLIKHLPWQTYSRSSLLLLLMLFALAGLGPDARAAVPEPAGWYPGDPHAHRSCGGAPVSVSSIYNTEVSSNLNVISLLADMGNGEVQTPSTDLPLVNGQDASVSTANRIVHWDAEWHWDATYTQYAHQALGGHVVALGLTNAYQIWSETTSTVFDWAHAQGGIAGFAHFQYLDGNFPTTLSCCTPVEYPVEVALGACDFISEDVNGSDVFLDAYYRLLNCGFRPGFAAGSDNPCGATIGPMVTFVRGAGGQLTYKNWVQGIAAGRTVISRNGRNEFLSLLVNGTNAPGDELQLSGSNAVPVTVQWTTLQNLSGTIELVCNGQVIASKSASVSSSAPASLSTNVVFTRSGWLCARRMGSNGHVTHTAAVFVTVNQAPIRASVADAQYFAQWSSNLIANTSPGGVWNSYFPTSLAVAQGRYQSARNIYQQIALEAAAQQPLAIRTTTLPNAISNVAYSTILAATGGTTPYTWSLASGALPTGLTLNASNGVISGTPKTIGTSSLTVRVTDSGAPTQTATQALSLAVLSATSVVGTIGNTNQGTMLDYIYDNGPWINAARFQAASTMTVSTMHAQVGAIAGKYKCAIYSDSGAQPSRLLGATAEVSNSTSGWQAFPLTTPVALSGGSYYWLAIWSDSSNAKVYYSDSAGTIRWGQYGYGNWPDPLSTSGGGTYKYCIYAAASVSAPTLKSITVSPATATIAAGATQQFSATGTYSDGSTQNVSSQATWSVANAGVATISTSGLATGAAAGTTTISAQVGTLSGTAALTVQAAPASVPAPILVVTNSANPFSQYYTEILLAEGLNEFVVRNLASLTSATLTNYDVVILGQGSLTAGQTAMFSDWVNAGGQLIAMRPDKQLAALLGLADAGTTLSEGYLLVNTAFGPGSGIVGQTIQYHGAADRYTLSGAASLATLYSNAQTPTANPAVTLRSVGSNGGQAAAFTYDLARSIIYTRQGNPAWAAQERDGVSPIRPDDLFYGAASFDPQRDWVDLSKVAIPQADEQQRLLANLIVWMDAGKKLLPRFWYFPHGYPAAVVMTGDDHGNNGAQARFDQFLTLSPAGSSVEDWTAIRATAYMFPNSSLTDAQAAAYNAAGFEIGLHLDTGCADYTAASLDAFFTDQLSLFAGTYPSLPAQVTHRIHCIAWSDYSMPASVSRAHGIRLDTSYYYWPPAWVSNAPGLFTGSGMPMRFATAQGNILDIYQATTQMTDESGQSYPYTIDTLLDRALGTEGYYGAFVANMHTDSPTSPGADAIVSSALSRGVPIITAGQLLKWVDARNASSFSSVAWNNGTASFTIQANPAARGLQAMAPVSAGYRVSAVSFNGTSIGFGTVRVKGIDYVMFPAGSGVYTVSYAADTVPPSITSVTPTNGAVGIRTNALVIASFSKPMNALSINSNSVSLRDGLNNIVAATVSYDSASNTMVLTPRVALKMSATYTATVKGGAGGVADTSGNVMASDVSWSFTTTTEYSLWPDSAIPTVVDSGPDSSVELGVKFKADVAGRITGIRFYKAAGNTGTHVACLWTSSGTKLATATFSGESASGWQRVNFATPVAIAANTVYVASYHAKNGHYSGDASYFAGRGVDNGVLHALANGVSGGNGVYRYKANSIFPNQSGNGANYWVDVVFEPSVP